MINKRVIASTEGVCGSRQSLRKQMLLAWGNQRVHTTNGYKFDVEFV